MSINTTKIARAAQEAMAALEHDEDFKGEDEILEVAIVIEVKHKPDDDEEIGGSGYRITTPTFCTNESRVYQTGLLHWACELVQYGDDEDVGDEAPPPD